MFPREVIFEFLNQYAYQPHLIYLAVVCFMLASSFGFPIPEEVVIISVGILAYVGSHPELFPPPYEGARSINVVTASLITFSAVLLSDVLIFYLGRRGGERIKQSRRFNRLIKPEFVSKVERWITKYGIFACGIFRFTPGLRFPGHLATGMLGLEPWKFVLVDGTAALLSVPTQIILISCFGEIILKKIDHVKLVLLFIIGVAILTFLVKKIIYMNLSTL